MSSFILRFAIAICLASIYLLSGNALAQTIKDINLIVNAGFDDVDAQGLVKNWVANGGKCLTVINNDQKWIKIENSDASKVVSLTQKLIIPAGCEAITVSARLKSTGLIPGKIKWQTASVAYRFLDDNEKNVGVYGPAPRVYEDSDWVVKQTVCKIPEGAVKIVVSLGLFHAVGVAEFDDIKIVMVSSDEIKKVSQNLHKPLLWEITWGQEPIESQGPFRESICLNGLWHFLPTNEVSLPDSKGWGLIGVPGSWLERPNYRTVNAERFPGTHLSWNKFRGVEVSAAWYERKLKIPSNWKGSEIQLELTRVSTDAHVYINNKMVGKIHWPNGQVKLTDYVKPGIEQDLRILVLATAEKRDVVRYMDADDAVISKAKLSTRGLIGDVMLHSRPIGAHLGKVELKPSFRNKSLGIDFQLLDNQEARDIDIDIRLIDAHSKVQKSHHQSIKVETVAQQTVSIAMQWDSPHLWDVDDPYLYTLELIVSDKKQTFHDSVIQEFGFREFWIQGRDFVLNGRIMRLRPMPDYTMNMGDNPDAMERIISDAKSVGFNTIEVWPSDPAARGETLPELWLAGVADRLGMLIIARMPDVSRYLNDKKNLNYIGVKEDFESNCKTILEQMSNHPSIVMWISTGNYFAFSQDQNPRWIGRNAFSIYNAVSIENRVTPGLLFFDMIRELDPTRPVLTHHGGSVGDAHTVNMYLNFHPLQEREEWLSDYVIHGDRPFMPVEFGAPLNCAFMRGRNGGGWNMPGQGASHSEPLVTEYTAIYLGPDAYLLETDHYRDMIKSFHQGNNIYKNWGKGFLTHEPNAQALLDLFVTNTWRSWRTWGLSGGMIPWEFGAGWKMSQDISSLYDMPKFQPGRRGVYHCRFQSRLLKLFDPKNITKSGNALISCNKETLAWIAGGKNSADPAGFTDKTHNYRPGDTLSKQLILINDTNSTQKYSIKWDVELGNQIIKSGNTEGHINYSEILKLPFNLVLPSKISQNKNDGLMTIKVNIGNWEHYDSLSFRVFSPIGIHPKNVALMDENGHTGKMLAFLGIKTQPWDKQGSNPNVLVIGRESFDQILSHEQELDKYVSDGGHLLIMGQKPALWESMGFRTAKHQSRRVFPVAQKHTVYMNLDAVDFCNWNGHSSLLEQYPDYIANDDWLAAGYANANGQVPGREVNPVNQIKSGSKGWPYAGWRWGNRHTVASTSIEKPHRSGWRPILQCEFDMAYTPLMELDRGKGSIVICTLDLEDHVDSDPVAERVALQLIDYLQTKPTSQHIKTSLIGGSLEDQRLLKLLGVHYKVNDIDADLVLVGRNIPFHTINFERLVVDGKRVLILPRNQEENHGEITIRYESNFLGSLKIPDWKEFEGLAVSDLHVRTGFRQLLLNGDILQVVAGGLLGKLNVSGGSVIFCQVDPEAFDLKNEPYLRLTRWRYARLLSQLLANMGATFSNDEMLLRPLHRPQKIAPMNLERDWRVAATHLIDPAADFANPHPDHGPSVVALKYVASGLSQSNSTILHLPSEFNSFVKMDGEALFELEITVSKDWKSHPLELILGKVDDYDVTYFNGVEIGRTGSEAPSPWNVLRCYRIPSDLVREGKNRITVRVWDRFGGGGLMGPDMILKTVSDPDRPMPGYYHPDYREDFSYGDDPYRYYRW